MSGANKLHTPQTGTGPICGWKRFHARVCAERHVRLGRSAHTGPTARTEPTALPSRRSGPGAQQRAGQVSPQPRHHLARQPTRGKAAAPRARVTSRLSARERREQLLDATKAIVARDGFHAVSIEAVAREAGITRPIVYGHFHDLPGLLEALVEREGARALRRLAAHARWVLAQVGEFSEPR